MAIAGPGVHSYWTARQGERQAEEQWKSQLARQPQAPPRAHSGDTVARLFIERLESHWVVIEGGHRDTQFRILWRVKIGEDISVEAGGRTFVYRVTDRRVVAPADTRSIDPTPTA